MERRVVKIEDVEDRLRDYSGAMCGITYAIGAEEELGSRQAAAQARGRRLTTSRVTRS
jgi:hypothetical protein